MIQVTRLRQRAPLVLNAELIQRIEALPDTTITLTSGEILVVAESVDEVVARVIRYQQTVRTPLPETPKPADPDGSTSGVFRASPPRRRRGGAGPAEG